MTKLLLSLFLIIGIQSRATGWDGGAVGNGGDVVKCSAASDNAFEGLFSLDYLLTFRVIDGNQDVVEVESWDESQKRISKLLAERLPELGQYFDEFVENIGNESDYSKDHIWSETPFGLVDIKDERIIRKLPKNCYKLENGTINTIQSVIRNYRNETVEFEYDYELFHQLLQERPLQFSFLMVHEFLWTFNDNPQVIRKVNRFLHSTKFEEVPLDQVERALDSMGFSMKNPPMVPVCNRSVLVKKAIEAHLGMPCESIEDLGLLISQEEKKILSMGRMGIEKFRHGDFAGLNDIVNLNLSNNRIKELKENTFAGLSSVTQITINANPLTSIPQNIFKDLHKLHSVSLTHNQFTKIPILVFSTGLELRGHSRRGVQVALQSNPLEDYQSIDPQMANLTRAFYMPSPYRTSIFELERLVEATEAVNPGGKGVLCLNVQAVSVTVDENGKEIEGLSPEERGKRQKYRSGELHLRLAKQNIFLNGECPN